MPADECLSLEALEWETEDENSPLEDLVPVIGMNQQRNLLQCGRRNEFYYQN